jgi:hypothetical protein
MERDLGRQPIVDVLARHGLASKDLVAASTEQITHKMVARAAKGRRLSEHVMAKVVRALNAATDETYSTGDLFTYGRVARGPQEGDESAGEPPDDPASEPDDSLS